MENASVTKCDHKKRLRRVPPEKRKKRGRPAIEGGRGEQINIMLRPQHIELLEEYASRLGISRTTAARDLMLLALMKKRS